MLFLCPKNGGDPNISQTSVTVNRPEHDGINCLFFISPVP
nr:MAG TPA: hypothetical protein [Caudoviricetes sp.]DAO92773.1 MAG TPA: hypothetical protein [Caudoviricetes sp.]DAP23837.1 MAG TPA: hypothetical protein [Caudoviricetes sp.]DAP95102.1 MAG TPA: hypothetical protein [Caudoviricetes sp.]DAS98393.1 MAG TPA: hypothetical protein [Bacteriophage sp.]